MGLMILLGLSIMLEQLLNVNNNLLSINQSPNITLKYMENNKLCIDILLLSDLTMRPGLYVLINSLLINVNDSNHDTLICIHILVEKQFELNIIKNELNALFSTELKAKKFIFEIKSFDLYPLFFSFIDNKTRIPVWNPKYSLVHKKITWARIWIPEIFINVEKAIYLDVDTITQTDISKLYKYDTINKPIWFRFSAGLDKEIDVRSETAIKLLGIYDEFIAENSESFNAGIYLFNLTYWRQNNITERCENIIIFNKNIPKNNLIKFADQSVLNIAFSQLKKENNITIGHLDKKWNVWDLGWREKKNKLEINEGYILHWNGNGKPWLKTQRLHSIYWSKYIPSKFNHKTVHNWSNDWIFVNE